MPSPASSRCGRIARNVARWVVVCAIASGPSVAAPPPRTADLVETSQVEVVEAWPFVVRAKKRANAAHCRALGPEALRVTEDGRDVRVLSVTSAPPLSTHVLLIDTSGSMTDPSKVASRKRGRQAKAAAAAYVDWLLEGTRGDAVAPGPDLMLLTFDDDLIMQTPPVTIADAASAAAVIDSIQRISGGYRTSLNDAVWRTVDYLATREGRSVVILLSDGADTGSDRTATDLVAQTQATNNVTLFAIGIGLRGKGNERFADFLERVARSTGGRYFGISGAPADLASRLDGRFAEIQRRLASQLYVSWLTEVSPGQSARAGSPPSVAVRIESRDRLCRVPDDGYRPTRAAMASSEEAEGLLPAPLAAVETPPRSGTLELSVTDTVSDDGPLVRYTGEGHRRIRGERRVQLDIAPFATAPREARAEPEASLHRWLLDARLPLRSTPGAFPTQRDAEYPAAGEINGKTFLELRDALAFAVWSTHPEYREWATARAQRREWERFSRTLPPPDDPQERAAYLERLALIVRDRVAAMGTRAYRDDLAAWFGDVPARTLADRLERHEANLLLANGAAALADVDRVQSRWVRLYDWLRIPDRVRVTAPLVLSCRAGDGPCGYHRIVLPRLADLPEDMSRPAGKTTEPTEFAQFLEYERIRVPRRPFGLMTVRWLLGLPPEPGVVAPAVEAPAFTPATGWRVRSLRHWPVERPVAAAGERPECLRRIRLDLVRAGESTWLELEVAGRLVPGQARRALPDACETLPGPVELIPRCVTGPGGWAPPEPIAMLPACPSR